MSNIPNWWQFLLLAGAAFRTWRLLAADTILDKPRDRLTRYAKKKVEAGYRKELDIWLHCPWCLGTYVTGAWWVAWLIWPNGTTTVAVLPALGAVVALVAQNLDGD